MKIRSGFVTNSSSTNFLIYAPDERIDTVEKAMEYFDLGKKSVLYFYDQLSYAPVINTEYEEYIPTNILKKYPIKDWKIVNIYDDTKLGSFLEHGYSFYNIPNYPVSNH